MGAVLTTEQLSDKVAQLARRYNARAAYLLGSYARGEADASSDIDVLIDGGPSFRRFDIFAIAEELFQAFGKRADVYEISELDEGTRFRDTVMSERVRIA